MYTYISVQTLIYKYDMRDEIMTLEMAGKQVVSTRDE